MGKYVIEIPCSVLEVDSASAEVAYMRTAVVVHVEAEHLHQAAERVGKLLEQDLQRPGTSRQLAPEPEGTVPRSRTPARVFDVAFLGTILLFTMAALIRECRS